MDDYLLQLATAPPQFYIILLALYHPWHANRAIHLSAVPIESRYSSHAVLQKCLIGETLDKGASEK